VIGPVRFFHDSSPCTILPSIFKVNTLVSQTLTTPLTKAAGGDDASVTISGIRATSGLAGCPSGDLFIFLIGRVAPKNFGTRMGDFNVIAALATLAYNGRRPQYFRAELIAAGVLTEADAAAIDEAADARVSEAVTFADESPEPEVDDLFKYVYATEVANAPSALPGEPVMDAL